MIALKPRLACGIVLLAWIWVCRISFSTSRVPSRMAAGGSPVHVMTREKTRPRGTNATPAIANFSRISDRLAGPGRCPCPGLPCGNNA